MPLGSLIAVAIVEKTIEKTIVEKTIEKTLSFLKRLSRYSLISWKYYCEISFHYPDISANQSLISINRSTPTSMTHFDWLDRANTIQHIHTIPAGPRSAIGRALDS